MAQVKRYGWDDATGFTHTCDDGARGEIVYNGNYFCSRLDDGCTLALPGPDPADEPERYGAVARLVHKLSSGLAANRRGQYERLGHVRLSKYTR